MIYIFGPYAAGKREYVRETFCYTEADFSTKAEDNCRVLYDAQQLASKVGNRPEELEKLVEQLCRKEVVIATETGCGDGATGATHDRTIDRAIVEATKIPCIIAGGLDPDNVAEAIHTAHPYGVDTCTRTNLPKEQYDITNGLKDREKVKAFIEATKNA